MSAPGSDKHLPQAAPIEAYGNGGFRFAGMSHRGSLLCLPDGIWAWPVQRPEDINEQSLALVFGGPAIHSFTATMMFGVVLVGTYTSIFIAAPILIYLGVGTGRDAIRGDSHS